MHPDHDRERKARPLGASFLLFNDFAATIRPSFDTGFLDSGENFGPVLRPGEKKEACDLPSWKGDYGKFSD